MNVNGTYTVPGQDATYTVKVSGFDEAIDEVQKMSEAAAKDALVAGLRAALRVYRDGVLMTMPTRRSGRLRRSLRTSVKVNLGAKEVRGRVSVGMRKTKKDSAFYAYFIERGTGIYGPKGKPYVVRARPGSALKTPSGPRASVTITGIRPRQFVKEAQVRRTDAALEAFESAFERRLKLVTSVWKVNH